MKTARWWILVLLLVFGAVVSWWFIFQAGGGKPIFTISEETTHVMGPVDEEGYIDYAAALNDRLGKDIVAGDNANVLIMKAVGPRPCGAKMPAEFYERLGMSEQPEQGDYFIELPAYLDRHLKIDPDAETDAKKDVLDNFQRLTEAPWKAADQPHIHAWLLANEKPLAVVLEATNRQRYYLPLIPKRENGKRQPMMSALLPTLSLCRDMASALSARAMQRLDEGRCDEAWQDLLACHRLARLSSRGALLIDELVGIAIDLVTAKADVAFLAHTAMDAEQVKVCLSDLKKLPPLSSTADKIDIGERFQVLDSLMMMDRGDLDAAKSESPSRLTGTVDWDPALRQINGYFDRLTAACRDKDRKARNKLLAQMNNEVHEMYERSKAVGTFEKAFWTRHRRGQHLGAVLTSLLVPAFGKMVEAEERAEQTQRNLYIAFALAAHHVEHGRYPQSLQELSQTYLATVPDDIFTNQPPNYRLTDGGYLLYSVGPNGVDDAGLGGEEEPGSDDVSVRMPPRKKQSADRPME